MLNVKLPLPVLLLALPVLLLNGCASDLSLSVPPAHQPLIPPLPQQARQTELPDFSQRAQTDIQAWLESLTDPSSPDKPAKQVTTP